jgi:hypothetical protein
MITELNKRPGPLMGWKSQWKKNVCILDEMSDELNIMKSETSAFPV